MATIKTWDTNGTFKLLFIHAIVVSKLVPVVCCYVRYYTLMHTNRNEKCWICALGIRGCRGKLYTNVDATQHADGWRVDPHALYHQQQLNELKRLAAGYLRPVKEIYDELASSRFKLTCCRVFSIVGPGPEYNVLQPRKYIDFCHRGWCEAAGAEIGPFRLSHPGTSSCLPFMCS
ncbi:hypothetical protein T03_17444 [Trichinella britovi]|uniref:FLYWCH-type domain-containing protein n=1 Tax=Trichinella britovi TaxID=45882 RepID=A0A0V1CBC7_TRIBR|nr:hypothetical protein T03_17444 [Trichinella britovi]